jgi:hypothetical protein
MAANAAAIPAMVLSSRESIERFLAHHAIGHFLVRDPTRQNSRGMRMRGKRFRIAVRTRTSRHEMGEWEGQAGSTKPYGITYQTTPTHRYMISTSIDSSTLFWLFCYFFVV